MNEYMNIPYTDDLGLRTARPMSVPRHLRGKKLRSTLQVACDGTVMSHEVDVIKTLEPWRVDRTTRGGRALACCRLVPDILKLDELGRWEGLLGMKAIWQVGRLVCSAEF